MENSSVLLKVVSILMIIFGSIALLVSLIAVAGAGCITALAPSTGIEDATAVAGLFLVATIIMLIAAVIQFVAGIVGVKNHNKPEKANVCIVFGILVSLVYVLTIILSVTSSGAAPLNIAISIVAGLVIPVLYLLGAFQLKKKANN